MADPVYSLKIIHTMRGLMYHNICPRCNGFGVITYGNTSTWRGGIGGNMMTKDVCSSCWGSGSADNPWPSHKEFEKLKREVERLRKKEVK